MNEWRVYERKVTVKWSDELLQIDWNGVPSGIIIEYADDIVLLVDDNLETSLMTKCKVVLQNLEKYCLPNHLIINTKKCAYLSFGFRNYGLQTQISICDGRVDRSWSFSYLGHSLDEKQWFSCYTAKIYSKCQLYMDCWSALKNFHPKMH